MSELPTTDQRLSLTVCPHCAAQLMLQVNGFSGSKSSPDKPVMVDFKIIDFEPQGEPALTPQELPLPTETPLMAAMRRHAPDHQYESDEQIVESWINTAALGMQLPTWELQWFAELFCEMRRERTAPKGNAKMTQANRDDPQSKFQASLRADINACEAVYPSMGPNDNFCYGLTKRERFAMAAMEGVLAGGARYEDAYIAKRAIGTADELLKELAK